MTDIDLLSQLNPKQQQAVAAAAGNILVLAGAGSGKTRVLTQRIAYLIQQGASPYSVLAVTFTNKAAGEMRSRLESLLAMPVRGMWVGTFHHIAHRLLRQHWEVAGLPQAFQILDSDDQYRLVKRITKQLGLDESHWPPKKSTWFINAKKDEGLRAEHLKESHDLTQATLKKIYVAYEQACQRGGLVDFAELLLRAHELWRDNPDVLQHYQQRFSHILVDEFQDTNTVQYAWLRLLASNGAHTMIVGDDDQSIYGWRGAKIENIQRFSDDFADVTTIRLEQNYRSTANILDAANALIANNKGRMGKELWTQDVRGEAVSIYAGFNEIDESRFIVAQIETWIEQGNRRDEVAILFRSNAQSRVLEETLIRAGIPYRVYGGLRFFDRAEIKDALAYLRLIANRHDDAAFERVVNTPTRGIGERTLAEIRDVARTSQISMWQAAGQLISETSLPARANQAVTHFCNLINSLTEDTHSVALHEQVEHMLQHSGLLAHYRKEKGEKAQARLENLQELISATRVYEPRDDDELTLLQSFLAHAALEAGDNQADAYQDCVQLMTLHSAKGLEFPLVFVSGMEEGLFPHRMSYDEPGRLEEERRLCYVGMTRAMQKLFLTYAEVRRLHGSEQYHKASRFISEIPSELLQEVRRKTIISQPTTTLGRSNFSQMQTTQSGSGLQMGQSVRHPKFGEGVVLSFEGQGAQERVQVQFSRHGTKMVSAQLREFSDMKLFLLFFPQFQNHAASRSA